VINFLPTPWIPKEPIFHPKYEAVDERGIQIRYKMLLKLAAAETTAAYPRTTAPTTIYSQCHGYANCSLEQKLAPE
jgi:hypothetical protein